MKINAKKMKLDLMLGALGALLMVVGDLALSIIHSDKSRCKKQHGPPQLIRADHVGFTDI